METVFSFLWDLLLQRFLFFFRDERISCQRKADIEPGHAAREHFWVPDPHCDIRYINDPVDGRYVSEKLTELMVRPAHFHVNRNLIDFIARMNALNPRLPGDYLQPGFHAEIRYLL